MKQLLMNAEKTRARRIDFSVPAAVPDAEILRALIGGLPMAGGVSSRIVRSRGIESRVTAVITWRQGVQAVDAWRRTGEIPPIAAEMVAKARRIPDETERLRFLCGKIARRVQYANTAPGRVGYAKLVEGLSALEGGWANCQGFADALYLTGCMAGLSIGHVIGWRNHQWHLWNEVATPEGARYADVSRMARAQAAGDDGEVFFLKTRQEFEAIGYVFEDENGLL